MFGTPVGTRRDFVLGCPSAFAACTGSWVDDTRWFTPHFSVRVSFDLGRWTACVTEHRTFTPVWPALWLHAHDRCRSSGNKEVQEVWSIYDERLRLLLRALTLVWLRVTLLLLGLSGLLRLRAAWRTPTALPEDSCRKEEYLG